MAPRRTAVLSALIAFLTVLAIGGFARPAAASASTTGFTFVDIPGQDGVVLKANWIAPTAAGPHPALIFPSSWGLNDAEYLAQAGALAEAGYVVISYTPRGWWGSGGEIDTAGPQDMADLSKVVDWTIANTATDPARIGAAGVSYGAGISMLGAAFDKRIRAVAMLSGWSDLVYSLYGDQTRHKQSAGLLQLAAELAGHIGPDLSGKLADFTANRNVDQVQAWARVRSPATYLDQINANHPAVLIANAWGDSIFPPDQLLGFFASLTMPKRLELRPGDHAIAELTGLLGLPNDVWTSLRRWMDQYLGGAETGIENEPAVQIHPDNAATEAYASWSALATSTKRYGLGGIRPLDQTGLLGDAPSTGWSKQLPTGLDTTADGGVVLLTNGIAAFTGQQPQIWLPTVDRYRAGVWASARPSSPLRIRGVPHVHLNLTGTAPAGTVVAYLYDLDALGNAKLITHEPVSWLADAGGTRTVDVDLSAAAYDVPAGDSLTLVVDTVDPLYYDANPAGASVTIAGGSYLDVPVR
jgi:predicted acyl esterase